METIPLASPTTNQNSFLQGPQKFEKNFKWMLRIIIMKRNDLLFKDSTLFIAMAARGRWGQNKIFYFFPFLNSKCFVKKKKLIIQPTHSCFWNVKIKFLYFITFCHFIFFIEDNFIVGTFKLWQKFLTLMNWFLRDQFFF